MDLAAGLLGVLLLLISLVDIFATVALPRSARRFRISRYVWRVSWLACRPLAGRRAISSRRQALLGVFGPLSVFVVLAIWLFLLLIAFGLIVFSLRAQIEPRPTGLASAIYLAGQALLTLGYVQGPGTSALARGVGLIAAATGLTVFALVITFLFSLFAAFREREVEVVTLEASAGAPPSGVAFLEFYASVKMADEIGLALQRWQRWAATVLDTHLAYPILAYFRSAHDNDSWISSLGAVMDAATLVLTTIEGGPVGAAKMARWVGGHCIDDLAVYFGLDRPPYVGIELEEFQEARARLAAAGYRLKPERESWEDFKRLRSEHAASLDALADYWATPPADWIGTEQRTFRHPPPRRPG